MRQTDPKPTLREVAKLAGVSAQTVSCVVNDVPVVSETTRAKVLAAIETLHYTPNVTARTLKTGRSNVIGLMIPDAHNPFFWQIVSGAEDEAQAHGVSLLLSTTSMNRAREAAAFHALLGERLDGLIPCFTYPEDFLDDLRDLQGKHFPFALFGSGLRLAGVDVVRMTYDQAARDLMAHLLKLGHRRIGLICGVGRAGLGSERVRVYSEMLTAAGVTPDARNLIVTGHTLQDGFDAAEQLLARADAPSAIIGINDLMAVGALQAALRRGLRVPQDVSVAGFDDIALSALTAPPLTTGRADGEAIGRALARLVLARRDDPQRAGERITITTRLMIRGSTGRAQG